MTGRVAIAATLVAATAGAAAARDYRLREETEMTHNLRFSGEGARTLDIRNLHGSIRVSQASGDTVELRARRTIQADSPDDVQRAKRESVLSVIDGLPKIEAIVQEPNGPICGADWDGGWQRRPRYHVTHDLTVAVPARTRLRLCTVNGNEVSVTGTTGDFDVNNVNGRIRLQDVRGSGSARTVNGELSASFLALPREDAEFKTVNGNVTVTWPEGLAAHLRLKTFNGGLFTDFPPSPVAVAPAPTRIQQGGRFIYRSSSQFTDVQIGKGGPTITIETLNGNVRVLQRGR